ncbi:MAG: hypothetical protein MZV70_00820 [Desulfobacterales bacterium]|nr:hypothetical protein [Desulfobacterales bacterium]
MALRLLDQADDGPSQSFVYGYPSHLAADTVAHETLTEEKRDVLSHLGRAEGRQHHRQSSLASVHRYQQDRPEAQ